MQISAYKHTSKKMDNITLFRSLGDETRLRILNLFIQSNEQLCVCELTDALQLPQYTISKALAILRNAGVLISGKKGTWVYNQLNTDNELIRELLQLLRKHLSDYFLEDFERLKKRLLLREDNICVIGVPLNEKLDQEVQQRLKNCSNTINQI